MIYLFYLVIELEFMKNNHEKERSIMLSDKEPRIIEFGFIMHNPLKLSSFYTNIEGKFYSIARILPIKYQLWRDAVKHNKYRWLINLNIPFTDGRYETQSNWTML